MKTLSKNLTVIFCLICAILIGICLLNAVPFKTFAQDIFVSESVSDENFSLTMSANARKRNITLYRNEQTITNSANETATFLCFNWRELESLKFNISANIASSSKRFLSTQFKFTHIKSETLDASIGINEPDKNLFQTDIYNNIFNSIDFYYYIDQNANASESPTRANGHNFGLYKFDLIYSFYEDEQNINVSTGKLGGLYVAVLPDKVEDVVENNVKILYSVASSNKLMNIFKLYLSNDDYKYVNPDRLSWNVTGTDKDKFNYVLTKKIKEENLETYTNYRYLYESLDNVSGNNFIFDSKDVEGNWDITCTIKNSDGSVKNILRINNLSTVKVEEKSYLWIIFLIIAICLLLAIIITMIVLKKKKDKVW